MHARQIEENSQRVIAKIESVLKIQFIVFYSLRISLQMHDENAYNFNCAIKINLYLCF